MNIGNPELCNIRKKYIEEGFKKKLDASEIDIKTNINFDNKLKVMESWLYSPLEEILQTNIIKLGYKEPRTIQKFVIPAFLKGHNLEVYARTGCGKTLAYLVSVIQKVFDIKKDPNFKSIPISPIAIILVPTKELVGQVSGIIKDLTEEMDISVARIMGGYHTKTNILELRQGCDITVATDGRLMALLNRGNIRISSLNLFVIDEFDYFVDIERARIMDNLVEQINETCYDNELQVAFFSSVLSHETREFLKKFENYEFKCIKDGIECNYSERKEIPNRNIKHNIHFVYDRSQKPELLKNLIKIIRLEDVKKKKNNCSTKILIFVDRIVWTGQLSDYLRKSFPNIQCEQFNGKLESDKREAFFKDFLLPKNDVEIQILVSTDVLSRGIDIPDLKYVINYDVPEDYSNFHHRIGRVGRINEGFASLIFDYSDKLDEKYRVNLINLLRSIGQLTDELEKNLSFHL
uniref:RNA helicase n=1 Tax=Parastrongyloides trichosuri TaxID=131310 RepID=A0A0N4ZVG6_PARTI